MKRDIGASVNQELDSSIDVGLHRFVKLLTELLHRCIYFNTRNIVTPHDEAANIPNVLKTFQNRVCSVLALSVPLSLVSCPASHLLAVHSLHEGEEVATIVNHYSHSLYVSS